MRFLQIPPRYHQMPFREQLLRVLFLTSQLQTLQMSSYIFLYQEKYRTRLLAQNKEDLIYQIP